MVAAGQQFYPDLQFSTIYISQWAGTLSVQRILPVKLVHKVRVIISLFRTHLNTEESVLAPCLPGLEINRKIRHYSNEDVGGKT